MEKVEWHDVQGLVRSGFSNLEHAAYILWHFVPDAGPHGKQWLKELAGRLINAEGADAAEPDPPVAVPRRIARPRSRTALYRLIDEMKRLHAGDAEAIELGAVNVALTASGLRALGLGDAELARFSSEFREGMAPKPAAGLADARRSSVLGDIGKNAPEHWEWGGNDPETIDGVLLLYAANRESLRQMIDEEKKLMKGAATPLRILEGRMYPDRKEHFGFTDGISQPVIEGTRGANSMCRKNPKQARISVVKPGEFVLGYLNERGARVKFASAPAQQARRDLGRNGTYLVFRQLEQNVQAFNKFLAETVKLVYGPLVAGTDVEKKAKEWVAARLIGRERSGEPLIRPAVDPPSSPEPRNDFLYHLEDRSGLACPIGAHIRRANPRDALGPDPDTALRLSKMHRIIRRGRLYGERRLPGAESEGEGEANNQPAGPRGLHFICLNSDIAGQFEMVQHVWVNGTHFDGLHHETDPMSHYPDSGSDLTIQARPVNMRVPVPNFITVRGGAYFFLPGIKALLSLAR